MFKCINLQIYYPIEKIKPFKQAENKRRTRKQIGHYLVLKKPDLIKDKNVLIVDDVSTTGSTLKAIINLVREAKPRKIKILVVSRRVIH